MAKTAVSLIHNKYVLYFVFAIALLNLFFSAVKHDYLFCALFILVGFITAFFNKNMTVILVLTMTVSNIVRVLIRGESKFEGMKEKMDATESVDKKPPVEDKKKSTDESDSKKKEFMNQIKNEAQDLLEVQQKIIQGFEQIEPEMTRAEGLIKKIDGTAKQIQAFQGMNG